MTALLLTASPFIVSALTGWVKNWRPFADLSDEARTPAIRVLAALIAAANALVTFWITGNLDTSMVDVTINTLVFSVLSWLGSLGLFHAFFQRKW